MNLVGLIVAALMGYALLIAALIGWTVIRPQLRGHTLGALLILTVLPPLAIVLTYWRTIDPLDAAVEAIPLRNVVRNAHDRACDRLLGEARRLVDGSGSEDDSSVVGPLLRCPVQTVFVASGSGPEDTFNPARCWARSTSAPEGKLCYRIGFVEFRRNGRPRSSAQLRAVEQSLRNWIAAHPDQEVYTIGYVHGWRHSAAIGDPDVRRLRTIAAYSAAALDERCRVTGRHCGALVMALYLSWPGQVGPDGPRTIDAALAAPTFPSRKRVSDHVGDGILGALDRIFAMTHTASRTGDRVLLLGHSLGGNAILSATIRRMRSALDPGHGAPPDRSASIPVPADLVVLLNPAAEESKLAEARELEERLARGGRAAASAWPQTTPPKLLILSARCEARATMSYARGKAMIDACDDVVETYFHYSQRFAERRSDPLDLVGIGHLARAGETGDAPPPSASHSLEVNYQNNSSNLAKTSYMGALDPRWRCLAEPGWLYAARTHAGTRRTPSRLEPRAGLPWSTGDGSVGERTMGLLADVGRPGQANLQFQFPPRGRSTSGIVDRYDPIWSADADPTAISKHGLVASSSLTCLYVKLLLDEAALPLPPEEYLCANARDYDRRNPVAVPSAVQTRQSDRGELSKAAAGSALDARKTSPRPERCAPPGRAADPPSPEGQRHRRA